MNISRKVKMELLKAKFLKLLSKTGHVSVSASAVGFSRSSLYYFRQTDMKFKRRWDSALEMASDGIFDEIMRRAIDGIKREIKHNGECVGFERVYCERLFCKLLKFSHKKRLKEMDTQQHIRKINRAFEKMAATQSILPAKQAK